MRALAAAFAGAVISLIPATAALAADPKPDISVDQQVDKASYAEGDIVVITVSVTNKGKADAKHVHYTGGDGEGITGIDYGVVSTGFDLAVGEIKKFQLTGKVTHDAWVAGRGFVGFDLFADNGDANGEDNTVRARFNVPGAFGTVNGFVYEGATPDTEYDPAKGIAGVKATVTSVDGRTTYGSSTTDAKGAFKVAHVPAGEALVKFEAPAGWKIMAGEGGQSDTTHVELRGDENTNMSVRAVRVAVPSASASPSPTAGPALPVTGSNTPLIVGAGLAAVVVGAALVLIARRRRVHLQA
ncbi:LPXTG cell wall anchor domain-containing protein [Dactylosporangium sp. CS-033363]|uniref:LPXTG cell wall anchor domain-containing protein n=1 Tax=Dactylosporangium sp. CS-033363 TaxID=3239935 RepID=UPI003D8EA080